MHRDEYSYVILILKDNKIVKMPTKDIIVKARKTSFDVDFNGKSSIYRSDTKEMFLFKCFEDFPNMFTYVITHLQDKTYIDFLRIYKFNNVTTYGYKCKKDDVINT